MAFSTVVAAAGQTLTVLVVVVLVFVAGPLRRVQGFVVQFDCLTMLPEGRVVNDAQTMISPCPIAVNIGQNYLEGVKYTPGKTIPGMFRSFLVSNSTLLECTSVVALVVIVVVVMLVVVAAVAVIVVVVVIAASV